MSSGTHDEAGKLVTLRGGPQDGFRAREGAPWLDPDHWHHGRYVQSDGQDEDNLDVWVWKGA